MELKSYTITQGRDRAPARAHAQGHRLHRRGSEEADHRHRQYLDRDHAVQLQAARSGGERGGRHPRRRAARPWSTTPSRSATASPWAPKGMKASLVSRDLIADSIELVARGHMFDGIVALVACDKTIPGAAMALLRLNIPGVVLYGGSILPGHYQGPRSHHSGRVRGRRRERRGQDQRRRNCSTIENAACPGAGACGGQFTANTMATVMEMIGLSPMGTAAVPQVDPRKNDVARALRRGDHECGAARTRKPRDIVTRAAFENAIASVAATRRIHQRRAASAGDGARSGRAAGDRRFPDHQRAHAAAGRSEAGGTIRRGGCR